MKNMASMTPSFFNFITRNSNTRILKTVIFSFGLSLLTACGAESDLLSSDDSSGEQSTGGQAFQDDSRAISGLAMKGIIRNGLVSVYAISNGSVGELLGSSSTDDEGDYRVYIDEDYEGPIQIIITAKTNSDSEMVCDAADGCGSYDASSTLDLNDNGSIDFGEAFVLNHDFELSAVVASNNAATVTVNVTTVTHMAARYAATLPNGLHSDGIAAANSQIAQLFNLSGDLPSLTLIDLTSANDRSDAEADDLTYSLIAAAVAAMSDHDTLVTQIDQLAQTFADHNGQLILNGEHSEITLEALLQEATHLADLLELNAPSTDLSQLLHQSQIATANSVSNASPSPTIGADNLAKAKALVDDLNRWQGIIAFEEEPTSVFSEYATSLQDSVLPEMNTMSVAIAASTIWGVIPVIPELAISSFCSTMGSAFTQSMCNNLVSTDSIELMCIGGSGIMIFGIDACDLLAEVKLVNTEQLKVTYDFFAGEITVVGTIEDHLVDMTMSTNAISDSLVSSGIITFNINGSIENDSALLTLDASTLQVNFAEEINLMEFQLPDSAEALFSGTLAQKSTAENQNPVSYTGSLAANIDLTDFVDVIEESETQSATVLLQQAALSLGNENSADFEFNLSGTLSADNGDTMDSSLVIHGGEDSYYSLSFDVMTDDLTTEANMLVTGALTTDPESETPIPLLSEMKMTLDYDGKRIEIERHPTQSHLIEIVNQDSVSITLDMDEQEENEIGEISLYDQPYATSTREGSVITFQFSDNSVAEMSW
ncbi:MAG: hypothetical protein KUG82_08125 [Pseudomonadales bacterium]|nr:hypothetical protein [Pseudomonadales bacterium]